MARIKATTAPYMMLTKPGIMMGNIITTAGGFFLASRGGFDPWLFLATMIGLSLIIASACVFNNYIDRNLDKKMARTKHRALALGIISTRSALVFGTALVILGSIVLFLLTNFHALSVALLGFFVYVIFYSFSKSRSVHGTMIGSIAGATPPVVGYCAVSGQFDAGALIFFFLMILWQMPHFFAIAIYRLEDYAAANIPVLPIKKGIKTTKMHMLLYILGFIGASFMLSLFGYTGHSFLIVTSLLGLAWLGLCIKGFKDVNDKLWARQMFFISLIVIIGVCIAIPLSLLKI